MTMRELTYQVSFNTPAFLGNSEQQAQWRTPPFKALLRQWWRVVKAPQLDRPFNVDELRTAENLLFGTASNDGPDQSRRSLVRFRLKHWEAGQLGNEKWPHREMRNIQVGQGQVRADVYLGFGPVAPASTKLNRPAPALERFALDPEKQQNELAVGFDLKASDIQIEEVRRAFSLASWFGGIGSRSRNGWGAISFQDGFTSRLPLNLVDANGLCQPFARCFQHDWPHAIGSDTVGPLIWVGCRRDAPFKNWREAVYFLATLRRDIRGAAKQFGRNQDISANQLIAYPVTKANNTRWGNDARIAGSLRLKVIKTGLGYVPVAVHLPTAIPQVLFQELSSADQRWVKENQIDIWAAAHKAIDENMNRLGSKQ